MATTEKDQAYELANRILDRCDRFGAEDPDSDIAVLARQFLRAIGQPVHTCVRKWQVELRGPTNGSEEFFVVDTLRCVLMDGHEGECVVRPWRLLKCRSTTGDVYVLRITEVKGA